MAVSEVEIVASVLFAFAILHTFTASFFKKLAGRFEEGSVQENLFHLLGEVEVVFVIWGGFLVATMASLQGSESAVRYTEGLNFTEPLFVFAIMSIAATKPVIDFASRLIEGVARALPLPREASFYVTALVLGPLLGSFITEPAAMTVTAILLKQRFYDRDLSNRFKYLTLGGLFVNVSIGGLLTSFAAPPVLMVAAHWGWNTAYMFEHFGWKAALAVLVNAIGLTIVLFRELRRLGGSSPQSRAYAPWGLSALHLAVLAIVVINVHHPVIFMGAFLFFLGFASITREYQDDLKIRESLLVASFLAGLVVLGGLQQWWLAPLLHRLNELPLFLGSTALTSITDNAALTYLGSQVEGISEGFKYALVAGATCGGGLTVIANAPNPAGYSILQERFGDEGIRAGSLFLAALGPTLIAMLCLWFL